MKKYIILLAACAMLSLGVSGAYATGVNVGVNTWYTQWKLTPTDNFKSDPSLMYGPVLGVDLAKGWTLTSVLLTGNFKVPMPDVNDSFNYRRYDSDTALNYSLLKWLKIFGGVKYMRYEGEKEGNLLMPFEGGYFTHASIGPALGVGVTLPVTESLFALVNFSGMYLWGKEKLPGNPTEKFIESGYNATLSLAYYIASYSTTLIAGVRYQYFKMDFDSSSIGENENRFYGITASVVYNFNIGSDG
ncbi:MAG: hypothetical protein EPN93_09180 [Spirochaetes bacterium]|nr:MAG: hypothetical protein EPN93_09180 [Spirochaetota bacterium]